MALTAKQEQFCLEYLIDLNAIQAAIRAGYSEVSARQVGADNMSKHDIQVRISELQAKRSERTEITIDNVLKELSLIGFSKIDDFVSVEEGEREQPDSDDTEDETFEPIKVKYKYVDIIPTKQIAQSKVRAISSIKQGQSGIEIKLHDKVKALELIGKHLGIFEKDNAQKAPAINIGTLDGDDIEQLIAIKKKANG